MAEKDNKNEVNKEFDLVVKEYNANMSAQLGRNFEKYAQYKVDLLRYLIGDKINTILNYGCGLGNDMQYFMNYWPNADLYGCDISEKSLEYAAEIAPEVHYFLSDIPQKIYEQEIKWDVVFLAGVLHHIPPDERSMWIKAISENVREGGYIAVFKHNIINPMTKHIVTHPIEDPPLDKLNWMLNLREIEKSLLDSNSSMRTYWKGYTLFSPIRATWVTKIETIMRWCPLGAQQCVIVKKD